MRHKRHLPLLGILTSFSVLTVFPVSLAAEELESKISEHPPERGFLQPNMFIKLPPLPKPLFGLDRHLSLLITDVGIVKEIRFSAVLDTIIGSFHAAGGNPAETKETLFHQLWDSANQSPGLIEPIATPHCDDNAITTRGFSFKCPRFEGDLAAGLSKKYDASNGQSPFSNNVFDKIFDDSAPYDAKNVSKNSYSAIAVSNRFDLLSPADPAPQGKVRYPDCGEVRVIFARNSGVSVGQNDDTIILGDRFERNLIAFEARIPNPDQTPQEANGLPAGCIPLIQFFRGLSDPKLTNAIRGKLLTALILEGKIQKYQNNGYAFVSSLSRPVVHFRNFLENAGQIRTNQFLNKLVKVTHPPPPPQTIYDPPGKPTITTEVVPLDWTLREFRLQCKDGNPKCKGSNLIAIPDTVKSTVGRELLAAKSLPANLDSTRALIKDITEQLGRLAGGVDDDGAYSNASDVGLIAFPKLSRPATAFESDSSVPVRGDIVAGYDEGLASEPRFNTPISDALAGLNPKLKGGSLTVANMIDRMRTQTCAGCHQFSDTKVPTPGGDFGFDPSGSLGLGAVWPNKACGDVDKKNCALPKEVLDVSGGAGKPAKNALMANQHPPMQFTMLSELILTRSVGDEKKGWRYATSTTVECLINARETLLRKIFRDPSSPSPAPCAP